MTTNMGYTVEEMSIQANTEIYTQQGLHGSVDSNNAVTFTGWMH